MLGLISKIWGISSKGKGEILPINEHMYDDTDFPDTFRMLNWNVWKARSPDFQKELQELLTACSLVTMQECVGNESMMNAIVPTALGYSFAVSYTYKGDPVGNMIGSKIKPSITLSRIAAVKEPWAGTWKVAAINYYPMKARNLLVINIHGLLVATDNDWMKQVDELCAEISTHFGPVIFVGDFNVKNQVREDYIGLVCRRYKLENITPPTARQFDKLLIRGLRCTWKDCRLEAKASNHFPILAEFEVLK